MSQIRHACQRVEGLNLVFAGALHLVVCMHGFSAVMSVITCTHEVDMIHIHIYVYKHMVVVSIWWVYSQI